MTTPTISLVTIQGVNQVILQGKPIAGCFQYPNFTKESVTSPQSKVINFPARIFYNTEILATTSALKTELLWKHHIMY